MITKITTKILLIGLTVGTAFTSCSNEQENIFDESAAERLNSVSAIYSQRLTDSKGGWVMEYYPYTDNENMVTGVGYLIMNRFNSNGSVYTLMKNKASYNTKWEDTSAWEVITDMGPVLTFNSWNKCYGRFTDPLDIDLTTGRSEDESGKGFQGDYEFVMVDVPEGGDHIMLKGKKRGIYQRLTRIPEGTDFEAYLNDIDAFKKSHFIDNAQWELLMVDNGANYRINYADRGIGTVYPADKDSTAYGWHMPFTVVKYDEQYHLRFKDSVMVGNQQMEQEFYFDDDEEVFHGMNNAENVIKYYPAPDFFHEMLAQAHRWKSSVAMDKSDDFKTALNNMIAEMAAGSTKYELNGSSDKDKVFVFRKVSDQIQLSFTVKFRRSNRNYTVELPFLFTVEETDGGAKLTYVEPLSDGAKNLVQSFPTITTFLQHFNGTFTIDGKDNKYSLRDLKFTSTTKDNSWFVLQYEN